ncbi:16S rRNA (guanine(966)-N(2))-methyltransferase RsmD [Hydrogenophaga crassostreae]|uniref:16S rRNA (Guanine(966)-N(2))-methyltransferase RsmD n=1 Tax=Hydrogenophaga crassostreae TaxID=1763535 RepID=A0A167IJE3_9BURK|nr:16S rRNA (guanine(966)-N(2))-methyltransferase RsmD [Hydrogenophaga crassostreae]AOW14555.1 16S rRNA (guanine(966)-N(2))-methyltransferase RsmD [Hydrogenophaga crassostreae]OAD43035.1 16S rRNA (guanine(966)-N(2))-methyltransferase RsmD [Hydrogenophaga crassostreae]
MKKPLNPSAKTASAAHEVRIIGGEWKRTRLPVPDRGGLRPTPSRVRETLFNWLGQDLAGLRCIDAFAGTGALGLEAASRGATEVVLVEQASDLVRSLSVMVTKLKASAVRVERGDGVSALRQRGGQGWDLVFLDPPFGEDGNPSLFQAALQAASHVIHGAGEIYLEAPMVWTDEALEPFGLKVHRHGKAGAVAFHLLRPIAVA